MARERRYYQAFVGLFSQLLEADVLYPNLTQGWSPLLNVCSARRITLYPVQDPILHQGPSYKRFEGTGLQGGWGLSSHRHFSATVFGGHTSTLDRYVGSVSYRKLSCGVFPNYPFLTAMSFGSTPASRYRHRAISSLRATATIVMRRMRPLRVPTRSRNQALKELSGW